MALKACSAASSVFLVLEMSYVAQNGCRIVHMGHHLL